MFSPDLDLLNMQFVYSAKATDRGVLPIFFLAPSSEKNILTMI